MRTSPNSSDMLLQALCGQYLRREDHWLFDPVNGPTLVFVPPLTAAEQATFADLQALVRATIDLSPDDWALIKAHLPALRAFRQGTKADFMALTQAARDRAIYDALIDIIATLVAMLRDK